MSDNFSWRAKRVGSELAGQWSVTQRKRRTGDCRDTRFAVRASLETDWCKILNVQFKPGLQVPAAASQDTGRGRCGLTRCLSRYLIFETGTLQVKTDRVRLNERGGRKVYMFFIRPDSYMTLLREMQRGGV